MHLVITVVVQVGLVFHHPQPQAQVGGQAFSTIQGRTGCTGIAQTTAKQVSKRAESGHLVLNFTHIRVVELDTRFSQIGIKTFYAEVSGEIEAKKQFVRLTTAVADRKRGSGGFRFEF